MSHSGAIPKRIQELSTPIFRSSDLVALHFHRSWQTHTRLQWLGRERRCLVLRPQLFLQGADMRVIESWWWKQQFCFIAFVVDDANIVKGLNS